VQQIPEDLVQKRKEHIQSEDRHGNITDLAEVSQWVVMVVQWEGQIYGLLEHDH